MPKRLFAIIDDSKQDTVKLQNYLSLLNYDSFVFFNNFENIDKENTKRPFEIIFVSSIKYEESEILKNIKKKYAIPIVIIHKDIKEIIANNIIPDFPIDYVSANYNLHELQLVIEKVLQRSKDYYVSSEEKNLNSNLVEDRYSYIYENTGLGIFQSTLKGKFIAVNKALAKMLGYTSPKELTDSVDNISSQIYAVPNERKTIIQTLQLKKNIYNHKIKCRRKDGIIIMLKVHLRLMNSSVGKKQYIEGIAEDYTFHNRAKDALKDNILQLKESHKLLRLASFQKNCLLNKYSLSENLFEILDITDKTQQKEFTEETLFNIAYPEDRDSLIQIWTSAIAQKITGFKTTFRIIGNSGKTIHINLDSIMQYNNKFEAINQYIAIQDVSEQKIAEEQLKVSLIEKEVLLREINHRVKNNLQVVSSILNLQSGYTKDKKIIEILNECKNRVFSMSLVHEKLCQSDNLARIDYQIYLKELLSNIIQSYNLTERGISVSTEMKPIFFPIDLAIPCGMIITELVSNAAKYAFPNNINGEIKIIIENKGNKEWKLTIKDNGIGFSKSFSLENTETLGLKLVDSLVEQINGSIEYKNKKGVSVIILFNEK